MKSPRFPYKTPYGHFSDDGKSFIITRPDTPRPWVNVMCSGTYGVVVSQTGSGYSWLNHASLNRITRWNQDLIRDDWGRYIFLRDEDTGEFWSASWMPVQAEPDSYECIHSVGCTIINSSNRGIQTQWLTFVPHEEPGEVWRLRIKNRSKKTRRLTVWTYMELNLGEAPDWHREFHKTFIETSFHDGGKIILAKKRLSPLKGYKGTNWNRTWDHVAWHASSLPVRAASGDKEAFLGNYGSLRAPAALKEGRYVKKTTFRWDDGIFSVSAPVTLRAGEERSALFSVGAADSQTQALAKARQFQDFNEVDRVWHRTETFWDKYMSAFPVETPDPAFNLMTNTWLKYQALSARLWGRTAYYQTGGAFGFRDQLQDSQVLLPIEADRTRDQIRLHAAHQFADGTAYHWWHPITESGLPSNYSDDLLWLPFVSANYLRETGDWSSLSENVPFAPKPGEKRRSATGPLYDHSCRAIDKVLTRLSKRGIPYIGEGDWNDGLSATGVGWKGESLWMGLFLYGVLQDWAQVIEHAVAQGVLPERERARARTYLAKAAKLKRDVNKHGWDGEWFWGATTDDGKYLGSRKAKEGFIFLNCQTWAILEDVVDSPARKKSMLKALDKYLYGPHGPLLLYPAYSVPDETVGYLTRYSPATRENGGIYFHAAVWALQMECRLGRAKKAWDLYKKMSPVLRGTADPELYRCEPYVTPGNVDGPGSPTPGRGGWTWYTGSAGWLYRISTEWFLGIRPEFDGLRLRPCLPPEWDKASAERVFRGGTYRIRYERDRRLPAGSHEVYFNGQKRADDLLPATPGRTNDVLVKVGPAK
jgi:cellobiose phosphorylase